MGHLLCKIGGKLKTTVASETVPIGQAHFLISYDLSSSETRLNFNHP